MRESVDPDLRRPAVARELARERITAAVREVAAVLRPKRQETDRLIDATEVARRLGLSKKAVYNRAASWPFTRRLGKATMRFSERGLETYLKNGRGHAK